MTTLYAILQKNPNHFRDMHEECDRMWQWGFDPQAQAELRAEVGRALGVDDAFMARVRHYPIHANILFPTLAAYIDATRAVYIANARAYQAEVAAAEAAERARAAMREWRADPVGGRTRMVKDIVREHSATDLEITRAFLRVHAGLRPKASEYQELDAYAAAWRDAIVKELLAFRATADRLFGVIKDRICKEARFLRRNGGKKTHPKARALRAWRRNAERMQRNWARSL
jgi:hypothetical protein